MGSKTIMSKNETINLSGQGCHPPLDEMVGWEASSIICCHEEINKILIKKCTNALRVLGKRGHCSM